MTLSEKEPAPMEDFQPVLTLKSPATEIGTRQALSLVMQCLTCFLPAEKAGVVEIALAEILNNIVEHAYADRTDGEIGIDAGLDQGVLHFDISDNGQPLPDGELPPGIPADVSGPRDSLPEGGFGWMLIREMASELRYSRCNGTNCLHVAFDVGDAAALLKP